MLVSQQLPLVHLPTVLRLIADRLQPSSGSPHVEFHLRWIAAIFAVRGADIKAKAATEYAPVLRAVQIALNELRANVKRVSDENLYSLLYVWNGIDKAEQKASKKASQGAASLGELMEVEAL